MVGGDVGGVVGGVGGGGAGLNKSAIDASRARAS